LKWSILIAHSSFRGPEGSKLGHYPLFLITVWEAARLAVMASMCVTTLVDKQERVLPWWRVDANGSYVFFVRLGSKPIEFEKGKNAIAVPSFDKIPFVINIVITAVRNGELDDQLAQAKKPATAATSRKAA
jgi:uncharacterized membrane protein YeiH